MPYHQPKRGIMSDFIDTMAPELPWTGDRSSEANSAHEPACFLLAQGGFGRGPGGGKGVLTRGRDVRIVQDEDGLVVESRHGGSWEYEFRADSLDQAIERAARHEVGHRFRLAHSRIALDGEHTLLRGRSGWQVERHHRLLGTSRGRTWGNIYQALLRPVHGGIKGDVAWLRRSVFELHQEAVGQLRDGLADLPTTGSDAS
jgi:hypothetical protein